MRYRYDLNGLETSNSINNGRSWPAAVSETHWEGDCIVIKTKYTFVNPDNGKGETSDMIQTIWLQAGTRTPWVPSLVVESTRVGVLGGITSTNRTIYSKGYYY